MLWDSATPKAMLWDSATPKAMLWDSAYNLTCLQIGVFKRKDMPMFCYVYSC